MKRKPKSNFETGESRPMYDFSVFRQLRKADGLTIEAVSQRSGISAAVISKLERNQTTAELETLYRLGRVFGMSAADLVGLAESRIAHLKEDDRYTSGDFSFRKIGYGKVTAFLASAPAGSSLTRPEVHEDENEVCWVVKGSVRLTLPHESYLLKKGQSAQFDALQPHTYEAIEDANMIIIHLRKRNRF